jgi:hypothetical protein
MDSASSCSCSRASVLRPCISNSNWGGFEGDVCGNGAQTLFVRCE